MKSLICFLPLVLSIFCNAQNTVDDIKPDHWVIPANQGDDYTVPPIPADLHGKVVLVDFWNTRCGPCIASIHDLNALAKNNPDLVVLSITFDNDSVINRFLKSRIVDYPIGIDVNKDVIGKFKFQGYPHTFLFDRSGKMIWDGMPYYLPTELIYKTLGRTELVTTLKATGELPQETKSFYLSVSATNQIDDLGTFSANDEASFNAYNYSVPHLVEQLYGYSGKRIICEDSILSTEKFDVHFKYYQKLKPGESTNSILGKMVPERFGFKIKSVKKISEAYELSISDTSLLAKAKTTFEGGTMFNMYNDTLEFVGTNLKSLAQKLENHYKMIFVFPQDDQRSYDFFIPRNDVNKAISVLSSNYGITAEKKDVNIDFYQVSKN